MRLLKLCDLTAYAIVLTLLTASWLNAHVEATDPSEPQHIYGKGFESALREKTQQLEDENTRQKTASIFRDQTLHLTTSSIAKLLAQASNSANASSSCVHDIETILESLEEKNSSALPLVDAWGKPPAGIMNGALALFGSYDECLAFKLNYDQHIIKGKYCPVTITNATKNGNETSEDLGKTALAGGSGPSLFLGTCFPSSCREEDVQSIFNTALNLAKKEAQVAPCSVEEPLKWKADQIVVLVILTIFGAIMAVATAVDGALRLQEKRRKANSHNYQPKPQGRAVQALLCFSVYTNSKKIFDVSSATQGRSIRVLHGMRFFSISWVVLGHSYALLDLRLPANAIVLKTIWNNVGFQVITSGTVSVDTFFFMSGLLVAYVALPELQKLRAQNKNFNFLMFYFHRYWRLTPALAMAIAITILWERFGSGPLWTNAMQETCRKNWWANLLYINNFYNGMADMCIAQSWYLANDFQFHLIAPLFLILLSCNAYVGIAVTSVVTFASIITTGIITVVNHYPPTLIFRALVSGDAMLFFNDVYIKPYCRISPYCVGILAGYILRRYPNLRLKGYVQIIGWLVTGATLLAVIFIPFEWNKGTPYGDTEAFLFGAFHRALWAAGLSWIVIASATGHGGVINEFLSWRAFIPLSRLSYMVFLVHFLVLSPYYQNEKLPVYFSHYYVIHWFLSILVLSFMLAFLCTLAFEAPFVGLERIFLRGRMQKQQNRQPPLIQNVETIEKAETNNHEDEISNGHVYSINNHAPTS